MSIVTGVGSATNARAGLVDVPAGSVLGAVAAPASTPAVLNALTIPAHLSTVLFSAPLIAVACQLTAKAVWERQAAGAKPDLLCWPRSSVM